MKTVVVLLEGAADEAQDALDGRTPLGAARLRVANQIAAEGRCGLVPVPENGLPWRRECLLAQAFGVDVDAARGLRRGPVDGWRLATPPADGAWVFRGEFITVDEGLIRGSLSGRVSWEETRELAQALNESVGDAGRRIEAVGPGAVVVVLDGVEGRLAEGMPASSVVGMPMVESLPSSRDGARLRELMHACGPVLAGHPVNAVRVDLGEDPANGFWVWGGGIWPGQARVAFPPKSTAVFTRTSLGRGMGTMLGATLFDLPPLRDVEQRYSLKLPDLLSALREHERVVIEIDAPGHPGGGERAVAKVRELDRIDQGLLGPLVEVLDKYRPRRMVVAAGGGVSCETGAVLATPLPLVVSGDDVEPDGVDRFDEEACAGGALERMSLGACVQKSGTDDVWH